MVLVQGLTLRLWGPGWDAPALRVACALANKLLICSLVPCCAGSSLLLWRRAARRAMALRRVVCDATSQPRYDD